MTASLLLALILLPLGIEGWRQFTAWEIGRNAELIAANGSQDNLRRGFHQRRGWIRFWWLLACALPPAGPLLVGKEWGAALLLTLGLAVVLAGYFARFFSPGLNLVRGLPEFHASGDSASWPDAGCWLHVRFNPLVCAQCKQTEADRLLAQLLRRVWRLCLAAAALLVLAAILLSYSK